MNDSRRFRMSTSFYMPVGDFDSKISTMREYLQKAGLRGPVSGPERGREDQTRQP